jgi:putative transposase
VVGWALHEDRRSELVIDAFRLAWLQRRPGRNAGLLFHRDRGSQYASQSFQQVLRQQGVQCSMSRKGNGWDNACSETVFGSLKVERLHGQSFGTRRQAKDEIIQWLLWYNQQRLHSTLNYKSPIEYEQIWAHQAIAITW